MTLEGMIAFIAGLAVLIWERIEDLISKPGFWAWAGLMMFLHIAEKINRIVKSVGDDLRKQIEVLQNTVDSMQSDIENLQGTVDSIQANTENLQGTVDNMQSDIENLHS